MNYVAIHFETAPDLSDILTAFLGELPFDSFVETDQGFIGYMPEAAFNDQIIEAISKIQTQFEFQYKKEIIPPKNWNSIWESNFNPIQVANFCGIRAEFHPPFEAVTYELVINPKMAFGTGHHETTYMMIQQMEALNFKEAAVFDFGCGTGILAILASKMGASRIDGIDIEQAAYENSLENALLNQVANISFQQGTLDDHAGADYKIILANINRNVILATLPALYVKLKSEGNLLLSGILLSDRSLLIDEAARAGFTLVEQLEKGEWCCLSLTKSKRSDD